MKCWPLVVVAALGCRDDKPVARSYESFEDVIAAWAPPEARQAWDGAWVLALRRGPGDAGRRVAVEVRGAQAKVFDGTRESTAGFAITRPCEAAIRGLPIQFAWADGALVLGSGGVGIRRGTAAVVCGTGNDPGAPEEGVYVLDGDRCQTWKPGEGGAWSDRVGVCARANVRGQDLVDVGTEHYSTTLEVHGELLASRAFAESRAAYRRYPSFEAAKAALLEEHAKTDPVAIAEAAGGTVGDTSTVAGIAATFAADRARLGELEVAAVVVDASTLTIRGTAYAVVMVADANRPKLPVLGCQSLPPAEAEPVRVGTQVVVSGRLDPAHDTPWLSPCTIRPR